MYSSGNSTECSVMSCMGKKKSKNGEYMYMYTDSLYCIPETNSIVNQLYANKNQKKSSLGAFKCDTLHKDEGNTQTFRSHLCGQRGVCTFGVKPPDSGNLAIWWHGEKEPVGIFSAKP